MAKLEIRLADLRKNVFSGVSTIPWHASFSKHLVVASEKASMGDSSPLQAVFCTPARAASILHPDEKQGRSAEHHHFFHSVKRLEPTRWHCCNTTLKRWS